jgi:hypothetical protein
MRASLISGMLSGSQVEIKLRLADKDAHATLAAALEPPKVDVARMHGAPHPTVPLR